MDQYFGSDQSKDLCFEPDRSIDLFYGPDRSSPLFFVPDRSVYLFYGPDRSGVLFVDRLIVMSGGDGCLLWVVCDDGCFFHEWWWRLFVVCGGDKMSYLRLLWSSLQGPIQNESTRRFISRWLYVICRRSGHIIKSSFRFVLFSRYWRYFVTTRCQDNR